MITKPCIAPESTSAPCPRPSVVTVSLHVPGGTIRGGSCGRHVEVVQRMVREEAARRYEAAGLPVPQF